MYKHLIGLDNKVTSLQVGDVITVHLYYGPQWGLSIIRNNTPLRWVIWGVNHPTMSDLRTEVYCPREISSPEAIVECVEFMVAAAGLQTERASFQKKEVVYKVINPRTEIPPA